MGIIKSTKKPHKSGQWTGHHDLRDSIQNQKSPTHRKSLHGHRVLENFLRELRNNNDTAGHKKLRCWSAMCPNQSSNTNLSVLPTRLPYVLYPHYKWSPRTILLHAMYSQIVTRSQARAWKSTYRRWSFLLNICISRTSADIMPERIQKGGITQWNLLTPRPSTSAGKLYSGPRIFFPEGSYT